MEQKDLETLHIEVEKKQNAKLVIPLALEYKKLGKIEQAINVLIKGLTWQPDYISMRVLLGTLYFENNMLLKAKKEFEKVVHDVKDNIFALKKLMDIYYRTESFSEAQATCNAILHIIPDDRDALSMLDQLEAKKEEAFTEVLEENFKNEVSSDLELPDISLDDLEEKEESDFQEKKQDTLDLELPDEESDKGALTDTSQVQLKEQELSLKDEIEKKDKELSKDNGDVALEKEKSQKKFFPATDTMADICIMQGFYEEALTIYDKILNNEPDNQVIQQKRHELAQLISFKNTKKKEALIKELTHFINKIEEQQKKYKSA
jgi:tetratricopeptide (TPR) repeat protein